MLAMAIWPPLRADSIVLPTVLDPVRWHAHELIYGYVPAIMTGFLLTAIPTWTGRLPVTGAQLLAPDARATAWCALATALLHAIRLSRWAGWRTLREPLVAILHIGYAFVPLGFALLALGILRPDLIAASGALHAWTAGAIGIMTLAVMTRASLGLTGRPLTASVPVQAIYAAAIVAARILAGFGMERDLLLSLSAAALDLRVWGIRDRLRAAACNPPHNALSER